MSGLIGRTQHEEYKKAMKKKREEEIEKGEMSHYKVIIGGLYPNVTRYLHKGYSLMGGLKKINNTLAQVVYRIGSKMSKLEYREDVKDMAELVLSSTGELRDHYEVAQGNSVEELSEHVSDLLQQGYSLCGEITQMDDGSVAQALMYITTSSSKVTNNLIDLTGGSAYSSKLPHYRNRSKQHKHISTRKKNLKNI